MKRKRLNSPPDRVIQFIESLRVPEGAHAGEPVRLAGFQREFLEGALDPGTFVSALSVARGGGKSTLAAGLGLAGLLGVFDSQPKRQIILAARSRDQCRIVFDLMAGLAESLDDDVRGQLISRRSPQLELEYTGDGGGHIVRAVPAIAKNILGLSPILAVMDERGSWEPERGQELEDALLSGLGKRNGRAVMISTSAPDDVHAFSRWLDEPPQNTYVQEHKAEPGLPPDDRQSLLQANPGCLEGIGASIDWLQSQARRAMSQGGSALTSFRNLNRNERINGEARDALLTVDQWVACEVAEPPQRDGDCIMGLDLGGSASMTAAALFWPSTGRLEAMGCFPREPGLHDRGQADRVGTRYLDMHQRSELETLGEKVVPVGDFLKMILATLDENPACIVSDRFRQSELEEAMTAAELNIPVVYRGMGYRDGSEDVERFRQSVFNQEVRTRESLLLRSSMADAVTLKDAAGNAKIAKGRSLGRIDAACAAVLAIAEAQRHVARKPPPARDPVWV